MASQTSACIPGYFGLMNDMCLCRSGRGRAVFSLVSTVGLLLLVSRAQDAGKLSLVQQLLVIWFCKATESLNDHRCFCFGV